MSKPTLEQAWQQATDDALQSITAGEVNPVIAECLGYALMVTSENSRHQGMLDDHAYQAGTLLNLASQVEGELRQAVIAVFHQVMEHIPPEQRASEYIDLAEISGESVDIQQAADSIEQMDDPYYRALSRLALSSLYPQPQVYESAWKDAEQVGDIWGRLDVWVRIGRASSEWRERAFQPAQAVLPTIDQPYWKVRGMAGLASLLPSDERGELLAEAFDLVLGIPVPRLRSHAMMILFPMLDETSQAITLEQFRQDFVSITAEYPLSTLMSNVSGYLPANFKRELLPRLLNLENLWYRLRSLAGSLSELDAEELKQVRRDMVLYWWSLREGGLREQVLTLCSHPRLFSVDLLGREVIEAATHYIIEVFRHDSA